MNTMLRTTCKPSAKAALPSSTPAATVYRRSINCRAPRKRTFLMVEMTRYTTKDWSAGLRGDVSTTATSFAMDCLSSPAPATTGGDGGSNGNGAIPARRFFGGDDSSHSGSSNSQSLLSTLTAGLGAAIAVSLALPESLCASPMPTPISSFTGSKAHLCLSLSPRAVAANEAAARRLVQREAMGGSGAGSASAEPYVYGRVGLSAEEAAMVRFERAHNCTRQTVRVGF